MSGPSDQGTNYFISGASRGIGYNLVVALLERQPNDTIFAGARDPSSATQLTELAKMHPNVHVVKLVVDDEESNKAAVAEIQKFTDRLDVVVANAGICGVPQPLHTIASADYKQQFQVNALGPLYMYKATYPLLIESRMKNPALPPPKFFITSSSLGSMGGFYPGMLIAPYGMSKAAANYLALSIHHQTESAGAVVVPYNPGLDLTDMLTKNGGCIDFSAVPGAISPEQGGADYAEILLKATRSEHGGKFLSQGVEGPLPW